MKRRPFELAVLAAAGVFVAFLVFSFRPGRRPTASKPRERVASAPALEAAGEPTTLLNGFDFTETVKGKPLLRIQAAHTIGYGPGAGLAPNLYAGEKVTLTAYPEDGAPVTVYSDRAHYDERSRESKLMGNVRWLDTDGSLAETDEAQFHPSTRLLEAPGKVHFTRGTMDFTAPSAKYDLKERVARFPGPIQGTGTGDESGGISRMTAHAAVYHRDDGLLELETAEAFSRTGDRFASDHLVLKLSTEGRHHPEWSRATGSVRGTLSPQSVATSAAPKTTRGRVERQYWGDESLATFDAEGKPQTFTLRGAPAVLQEPDRKLTAPQIELTFTQGKATSARAAGGVRIDGPDSRAEGDSGSLGFGKDGEVENATLDGNVRIDSPDRKAQSARAAELDSRGIWVLTGDAQRTARVQSGGSRLAADRIEIERPLQQIRAEGKARAVFSPDPEKKTRTITFVGDPKRPAYGQGNRIALDDTHHVATLSGSASLWQDTSSLFADDITLSDADQTVTAVKNVRAVMSPPKESADKRPGKDGQSSVSSSDDHNPPGGAPDRTASVILAKKMVYRETDRSARFEGGVTVTRGGWHATGGETTAWLTKGQTDQSVDCVEISGDVKMVDRSIGRSATAEKALDYPKLGKTVLWGSPARVVDSTGNQVAGAILTITDRGRSVEITAPEGGKTETIHRTEKN